MPSRLRYGLCSLAFALSLHALGGCGASASQPAIANLANEPNATEVVTGGDGSTTTSMSSLRALSAKGNTIVDSEGQVVVLRGTNLGGWLVLEDWMCGISDSNDSKGRFALETLESRFGTEQAAQLLATWQDNQLTSADFDALQAAKFNVVRLPFHWRNFQDAQGNWLKDGNGKIDFSRLDWAVAQAGQRGMYVIPVFHIWDSQQTSYSRISGSTSDGADDRARAAALWTAIAEHFLNNTTIAAFDVINEPTGSAGNVLQNSLYKAVRAADPQRMIVMESVGSSPKSMGWTNVVYSFHEYNMMGSNYATNQNAWKSDVQTLQAWMKFPAPVYVGEFMAGQSNSNPTLSYLLGQMNDAGYSWTSWTYKGVNNVDWAMYNYPNASRVNLQTDSFDQIQSVWSHMGDAKPLSTLVATLKSYAAVQKVD